MARALTKYPQCAHPLNHYEFHVSQEISYNNEEGAEDIQ